MSGYEHDRNIDPGVVEFGLQVQATYAFEPDIKHQTARRLRKRFRQELFRRAKGLSANVYRPQQAADPLPDCGVIVDDEYGGLGLKFNLFRRHERCAVPASSSAGVFPQPLAPTERLATTDAVDWTASIYCRALCHRPADSARSRARPKHDTGSDDAAPLSVTTPLLA